MAELSFDGLHHVAINVRDDIQLELYFAQGATSR